MEVVASSARGSTEKVLWVIFSEQFLPSSYCVLNCDLSKE